MSLSQKHSGLVLVPWFNIAEWKSVYSLIYSEEAQNWPRALAVIKIWKLRTPLLSAGVEGTLILLEALLVDTTKLSSYEVTHIFSTSIVRFLNLCAANSDKQGTFYKNAMKNGLPKWLISMRHDIAHSHNVPSQSMLEMSLKFCLDWLKEKYWEIQHECMADLIANELDEVLLEDAIYIHFNLNSSEALEDNPALMERVSKFIINNKKRLSSRKILEQVNNSLKEIIQNNFQEASDKICQLLISENTILATEYETDNSGNKRISSLFISKWNSLLNIMHETEMLPNFIYKLFNYLCNDGNDSSYKEAASLWIREIFRGLVNQENSIQDKDALRFRAKNNSMKNKDFANQVLDSLTPFTLIFIKEVLEYNEAPPQFIEDVVVLISSFNTLKHSHTNHVSTVNDLNLKIDLAEDDLKKETRAQKKSPWILIEDTIPYRKLPLGILPNQSRIANPLLGLDREDNF